MASLYDAKKKLTEELNAKIYELGSGKAFVLTETDVSSLYAKCVGVVEGLKLALDIIARVEGGQDEGR
jgi:hypothetical protein